MLMASLLHSKIQEYLSFLPNAISNIRDVSITILSIALNKSPNQYLQTSLTPACPSTLIEDFDMIFNWGLKHKLLFYASTSWC